MFDLKEIGPFNVSLPSTRLTNRPTQPWIFPACLDFVRNQVLGARRQGQSWIEVRERERKTEMGYIADPAACFPMQQPCTSVLGFFVWVSLLIETSYKSNVQGCCMGLHTTESAISAIVGEKSS